MTKPMTPEAAGRIQKAAAKKHGGNVPKNDFAARAQKAAAKNPAKTSMTSEAAARIQSSTAKKHGGNVPKDS